VLFVIEVFVVLVYVESRNKSFRVNSRLAGERSIEGRCVSESQLIFTLPLFQTSVWRLSHDLGIIS